MKYITILILLIMCCRAQDYDEGMDCNIDSSYVNYDFELIDVRQIKTVEFHNKEVTIYIKTKEPYLIHCKTKLEGGKIISQYREPQKERGLYKFTVEISPLNKYAIRISDTALAACVTALQRGGMNIESSKELRRIRKNCEVYVTGKDCEIIEYTIENERSNYNFVKMERTNGRWRTVECVVGEEKLH